jgi:acyl-CoA synthetase (AMP-forming)/AMP-acid ligase II
VIARVPRKYSGGGRKVYPADVEQLIRAVPGVRQVRVFGMPSSITGQIVSAEVEPMADVDRADLQRRIFDACRQHLARHQLPRSIAFCGPLQLNASGKLPRAEVLYGV